MHPYDRQGHLKVAFGLLDLTHLVISSHENAIELDSGGMQRH